MILSPGSTLIVEPLLDAVESLTNSSHTKSGSIDKVLRNHILGVLEDENGIAPEGLLRLFDGGCGGLGVFVGAGGGVMGRLSRHGTRPSANDPLDATGCGRENAACRRSQHVHRDSAVRALNAIGFKISRIDDVTPIPHNGCRPPKKRRV